MCFRDLNLQNINRVHGQLTAIKGGNEVYSVRLWGLQPSLPLSTFISQNATRREGGRIETQEGIERLKSRGYLTFTTCRDLCALLLSELHQAFFLHSGLVHQPVLKNRDVQQDSQLIKCHQEPNSFHHFFGNVIFDGFIFTTGMIMFKLKEDSYMMSWVEIEKAWTFHSLLTNLS